MEDNKKYVGYYSAKAELAVGCAWYSTPTRDRVKVSEVITAGKEPMSKWDDLVCIGEVLDCVETNSFLSDFWDEDPDDIDDFYDESDLVEQEYYESSYYCSER